MPSAIIIYISFRRHRLSARRLLKVAESAIEKRQEARKTLEEVTRVVKATGKGEYACQKGAQGHRDEDSSSVLGREW